MFVWVGRLSARWQVQEQAWSASPPPPTPVAVCKWLCYSQVQRDRSRFATLQLQNLANAWRKQAYPPRIRDFCRNSPCWILMI